ncbi:rhomboid family intramembrane serine protease [Demequina muriae]|uniref:Rhomboid family intramembrane serine protease n=1 Tax=Demequina muriae TaxID=3051664 RepID=A0ABT8GGY6_9MICO|nr:rhomboid family intramembrane serine protease [Demequina sp. EGI L300058]MDN4480529.1 rhomboid family intramembrane serine protease [Demequina sp. EGI L300058]
MTQPPDASAPPTCPRHPDRVAYVRCQRCERPACPECQRPAAVGVLCVDCLAQAKAQARPMRSRLGFTAASGPPLVTYVLVGLNVAVFLLAPMLIGDGWEGYLGLWPGASPELIAQYVNVGDEWYRWVTAGFVQFGFFHIAMNMVALWQLGNALEPAMGRVRFAALYFGSLLGSSAGVMLLASEGVHGGASGAIFGLLAAYGIVLKRLRLPYQSVLVIAAIFIGGPLVSEFIPALSFFAGLSWQGHLGGAVVGAIIMLAMFRGVDSRERAARAGALPGN